MSFLRVQWDVRQRMEGGVDTITKALDEPRIALSERESKELLRTYGIPVTRESEVSNQSDLMDTSREIGFPLVMKACARNLSHKTAQQKRGT